MVVVLIENKENIENITYINYICDKNDKNYDHLYVRHCLFHLFHHFIHLKEKVIYIVSDGGPHHFKVNTSIYLPKEIQRYNNTNSIHWIFYGSHHGKDLCDSHTAIVKEKIAEFVRKGWCIESAYDIIKVVEESYIKNTYVYVIDNIYRKFKFGTTKIKGIKKFHHFIYHK